MSNPILQKGLLRSNVPLLANAIELGAQAIREVAGNAVTNTVDGQPLSPSFLHAALSARLQTILINSAKNGS